MKYLTPFFQLIFVLVSVFPSFTFAADANKVVVIPLFDDDTSKCVCEGTLSNGKRWCNNGDGTVTDMTTCLVWLKNSDCMGSMNWDDAVKRLIEELRNGVCGLSDGSIWGDWRLPKAVELGVIFQGDESVRSYDQFWFTGVQSLEYYWSRTRVENSPVCIYAVMPGVGTYSLCDRAKNYFVWPVRAGNQ